MAKDGELLYRDGNHISTYASSLIAKYVMENSSILKKSPMINFLLTHI